MKNTVNFFRRNVHNKVRICGDLEVQQFLPALVFFLLNPFLPLSNSLFLPNQFFYMFLNALDGKVVDKDGTVLIDKSAASLMASDVIDYITAAKEVAPAVEGRILIKK